jgi:hypothetical protein
MGATFGRSGLFVYNHPHVIRGHVIYMRSRRLISDFDLQRSSTPSLRLLPERMGGACGRSDVFTSPPRNVCRYTRAARPRARVDVRFGVHDWVVRRPAIP